MASDSVMTFVSAYLCFFSCRPSEILALYDQWPIKFSDCKHVTFFSKEYLLNFFSFSLTFELDYELNDTCF